MSAAIFMGLIVFGIISALICLAALVVIIISYNANKNMEEAISHTWDDDYEDY